MHRKKALLLFWSIIFSALIIYGCKDDSVTVDPDPEEEPDTTETPYNYDSEYYYNLNVIYFVPNNVSPVDEYHQRLSGMLLYIQDYYKKWMAHWGFEDKTFGLLKDIDEERIKITRINAGHPVSAYPNEGGGYTIRNEIREYFSHPDREPDSKHYLVFVPEPKTEPEGGLPFYGIGRWGFVIDKGQTGTKAETEGGGFAHELGHALNLPHNAHMKSQKDQIGTALMSNGNVIWNRREDATHTSLTEPSAEILNLSQAFSRKHSSFYDNIKVSLKASRGKYENGNIVIAGKFRDNVHAEKAVVLLDPEGRSTYDQMGWTTSIIDTDSFHVNVPTDELFETGNADYFSRLWIIHNNGSRSHIGLEGFSFENGVPNIDFRYGKVPTHSKEEWKVTGFSDEEPSMHKDSGNSMIAKNIIDGDFETFWNSRYSDVNPDLDHPHYITVDMGKKEVVEGFQVVQRQDLSLISKRSRIKELKIQKSDDGNNWEDVGEYKLKDTTQPQQIYFNSPKEFRYFKIVTKSNMNDGPRASLSEAGIF